MQRQTDVFFNIPDSREGFYKDTLSLPTDMYQCSEDWTWPLTKVPLYSQDELFQNVGNPYLEGFGEMVGSVIPTHQNNQACGDSNFEPLSSLEQKRVTSQLESSESASPPKRAKIMSKYPPLAAKSTASSAEIVNGARSHSAEPQEPKKGRRFGPLKPKTRQKASDTRIRGACAYCYTNHISVRKKVRI